MRVNLLPVAVAAVVVAWIVVHPHDAAVFHLTLTWHDAWTALLWIFCLIVGVPLATAVALAAFVAFVLLAIRVADFIGL